jgi:hypothetical protein
MIERSPAAVSRPEVGGAWFPPSPRTTCPKMCPNADPRNSSHFLTRGKVPVGRTSRIARKQRGSGLGGLVFAGL